MTAINSAEVYDPIAGHDKYTYSEKFHWLQKWLWFCAGADVQLMKRCPRSEQIKEEGIGGIVLATALLAFLSGSYAMYVVFGPKVGLALSPEQEQIHWPSVGTAVAVGFVWALVILNIDRFVVSSTGHGDGTDKITWGEFGRALPRLAMAIIIGLCLSKPLEIRVMKTEIEAELRNRQLDEVKKQDGKEEGRFKAEIAALEQKKLMAETKIRNIDDDIRNRENNITRQRRALDDEVSGKSPNATPGEGPAFRRKLQNLEEMKVELDKYVASVQDEKTRLRTEAAQASAAADASRKAMNQFFEENRLRVSSLDGLITRIHIADDIGGWSGIFLAAILVIIEVAPIFFKMMMPRGPYLSLVDNQAAIVIAREAITKDVILRPGDESTRVDVHERFHKAETISAFNVAQLESERELAQLAITVAAERKAEDIRTHPERYVSGDSVNPPTV